MIRQYAPGVAFHTLCEVLKDELIHAPQVDVGELQSKDISGIPQLVTRELENVSLEIEIPGAPGSLERKIQPNMPWAEDHFQERVGGRPLNPGVQYKNWPWYKGNVEQHQGEDEQFSHSYMERFWPKFANEGNTRPNGRQVFVPHNGVRFEYGDLADVVSQLRRNVYTRQAYLPVWFPEDTGAVHGERVPCSLGYQFMVRNHEVGFNPVRQMTVTYTIRSCDFVRHFRDDVYMAGRLMQWMVQQLRARSIPVFCGSVIMHITSLHIFEGDLPKLRGEIG